MKINPNSFVDVLKSPTTNMASFRTNFDRPNNTNDAENMKILDAEEQ